MPAPPPESEPATISTRPFIAKTCSSCSPARTLRRSRHSAAVIRPLLFSRLGRDFDVFHAARGCQNLVANRVDDVGQQLVVLALGHAPDHRLGSRFADHQPPRRTETHL